MSGFFLIHRGWQEQPLFGNEPFDRRSAFIWLIENTNFADKDIDINGKTVTVKRGQICASLRFMAKAWKWDEAKVRRFLKRAQVEKIIDAATDAGQTIITICNYEKYQAPKKLTDAANDAEAPQQRRGGDAKYKEGKEGKENTNYVFAGQTVKLNQCDFDKWATRYSGLADIKAQLGSLDDWISGQPEAQRKNWFNIVSGALNKRHQAALTGERDEVIMPVA